MRVTDEHVSAVDGHLTEATNAMKEWRTYRAPVHRLVIMGELAAALEVLKDLKDTDE